MNVINNRDSWLFVSEGLVGMSHVKHFSVKGSYILVDTQLRECFGRLRKCLVSVGRSECFLLIREILLYLYRFHHQISRFILLRLNPETQIPSLLVRYLMLIIFNFHHFRRHIIIAHTLQYSPFFLSQSVNHRHAFYQFPFILLQSLYQFLFPRFILIMHFLQVLCMFFLLEFSLKLFASELFD